FVFFFFSSRRRHTRFSRDWSSDVCSSDLILTGTIAQVLPAVENKAIQFRISLEDPEFEILRPQMEVDLRIVVGVKEAGLFIPNKIGRASCRERGENIG